MEPVLTVRQIVDRSSMTHNTVQAALNELMERSVVYEVTGRQKGRSYACSPVLDAIFGHMEPRRTKDASDPSVGKLILE